MNNNKLNLKLKTGKSVLNEIVLYEQPDAIVLQKLINSTLLKETFHCKTTGKIFKNERQQLIEYQSLINKDGLVPVIYQKAHGIEYGRVYPYRSLGAVGIRRELRGSLFNDNMIDIDIENCHPVLSKQLCDANGIKNKYLSKYVDERPLLLKEIQDFYKVDRDNAKVLFIILLYFGSFERWKKIVI